MQGKSNKQYEESTRFTLIGWVGIIVIIFLLTLGVGEYTGFNKEVREGLENDPRPLTPLVNYMHPNSWTVEDSTRIVDSLRCNDSIFNSMIETNHTIDTINVILDRIMSKLDSLEERDPDMMYHREYHGKEGKNGEWGEYVPTENDEWGDQGPCGGDEWVDENEMHYIDEDVMWIGNDGDTIWE